MLRNGIVDASSASLRPSRGSTGLGLSISLTVSQILCTNEICSKHTQTQLPSPSRQADALNRVRIHLPHSLGFGDSCRQRRSSWRIHHPRALSYASIIDEDNECPSMLYQTLGIKQSGERRDELGTMFQDSHQQNRSSRTLQTTGPSMETSAHYFTVTTSRPAPAKASAVPLLHSSVDPYTAGANAQNTLPCSSFPETCVPSHTQIRCQETCVPTRGQIPL